MELTYESPHWEQSVNEYKLCLKPNDALIMHDIRTIIFDFYPYNFVNYSKKGNNQSSTTYIEIRDDYFALFEHYNLVEFIQLEFQNLLKVKVVKKTIPMTYAVSISPPDGNVQELCKVVNNIIKSKNSKKIYGVFEYGRQSGLHHCHFLIEFNDKDGKQNLKKMLTKKKWQHDIDTMGGPVHVLKTLRYFHQSDKKNAGFINEIDRDYFLSISGDIAPVKFTV